MSGNSAESTPVENADLEFDKETLRKIRERVLQAEKDKLNLDLPRGINDEIEQIVREEIQ